MPISFLAVLVQLDLRDVGKCTGISREPEVMMEKVVVACLAAFGMTEYSVMWHRELSLLWGELPPAVSQGIPVHEVRQAASPASSW